MSDTDREALHRKAFMVREQPARFRSRISARRLSGTLQIKLKSVADPTCTRHPPTGSTFPTEASTNGHGRSLRGHSEEFVAEIIGGTKGGETGRYYVRKNFGSKRGEPLVPPAVASSSETSTPDLPPEGAADADTTPRVRDRAYRLWEQAGRPYGREYEFWFQAAHEIEGDIEARKRQANEQRIVAR